MKALGCGLWAVGQSQRLNPLALSLRRDKPRRVSSMLIWRVEFAAPTQYTQQLKTVASGLQPTAYSLQPHTEVTP
jgi:hypothetical protein